MRGVPMCLVPAGEFTMGNQEPIEQLRKEYPQYDDYRNYNTPQSRYFNLGFRVVLEDR